MQANYYQRIGSTDCVTKEKQLSLNGEKFVRQTIMGSLFGLGVVHLVAGGVLDGLEGLGDFAPAANSEFLSWD